MEISVDTQYLRFLDPATAEPEATASFEGLGIAVVAIDIAQPEQVAIPERYSLDQNYPNPFNPATKISYALPQTSQVQLKIYNLRGELVKTLHDGEQAAGYHFIEWDGTNNDGVKVATGMYLYKLTANNFVETKKMVFAK